MIFPTKPYFGLRRTMYLQTLANRWGDFGVSWNFTQADGEIGFTKKRSVLELWQEDYDYPTDSRLEKVMHREAMPIEHFIEIDDEVPLLAYIKKKRTITLCKTLHLEYAVYKSRKGYHISVLDPKRMFKKEQIIRFIGSDSQFMSRKCTWSMEWTNHWKQKNFVIQAMEISQGYSKLLLGSLFR